MPVFAYRAVSAEGRLVQGSIEAMDRGAAVGQLQQRRLVPLAVNAPEESGAKGKRWARLALPARRLGPHREIFARTLATLLGAGIPMDRSLDLTSELLDSPPLKEAVVQLLREVRGGKGLGAAMEMHPRVFPAFYASMVRAGEAGGDLPGAFLQLADYQAAANDLRGQVSSALVYPTLLMVVGTAAVIFLMQFVVPKFAAVFQQSGAALPLPTQILLGVSHFIGATWWLWVAGLPVAALVLTQSLRSGPGREWWDRTVLALPKAGGVIERVLVARFARSLGSLLRGGVPMLRSLEISGQVVGNQKLARAVNRAAQGVKQGRGLAAPLRESGAFPPLLLHLVGVGEETGGLDGMLLHVAEVYEREARTAIKSLVALFEPLMIVAIGIVVGSVVISILLAVFSVNQIPM
ncbi:MAG TPA: type II secretion system F family protein [Candidatus Acidoferrales bacterium]|nr:type II secretion system F family protein [Candidatus Acidoferrales bacterium]